MFITKKSVFLGTMIALLSMVQSYCQLPASTGTHLRDATACTGTATTSAPMSDQSTSDQKKSKEEAQTNPTPLAKLYATRFPQGMPKEHAAFFPPVIVPTKKLNNNGVVLSIQSIAWHPAGTHLAIGFENYAAAIWNIERETMITIPHEHHVYSVAWHPAGTHLATAAHKSAFIRDANGNEIHQLPHKSWVSSISWHPTGNYLTTGSKDGTIVTWDMHGKEIHRLQTRYAVTSVAWHRNGTQLVFASREHNDITICDLSDPMNPKIDERMLKGSFSLASWHPQVSWHPNGIYLAIAANESAVIWDTKNKQIHTPIKAIGVRSVAWHPTLILLATASLSRPVAIWDIDGKNLYTAPHAYPARSVAWNPAGTHLATTASWDNAEQNTIVIWDVSHVHDPHYKAQHEQWQQGTLPPEQGMLLIHLFEQCKKQNGQASLKDIATRGITTAELARTLASFHPALIKGIIGRFNIADPKEYIEDTKALDCIKKEISPRYLNSNRDIEGILEEYIVEANPVRTSAINELTNSGKALEKTKQEREQTEQTITQLFDAIQAGNAEKVLASLTSFTINARGDLNRTPLMQALYIDDPIKRLEIVKKLLDYKGIQRDSKYHQEEVTINLELEDYEHKTAAMIARELINRGFKLDQELKLIEDKALNAPSFKRRRFEPL